jgi:predicted Zn-dependent peptidase
MPEQLVHTFVLPNGLTLLIEPMADVQSAAFSLLVPGGSIYDPADQAGCASVLVELLLRGAGNLDSEALTNALDNLGLQRHEGVGRQHISFHAATLAENLPDSLRIYADIVRRPRLPSSEFKAAVAGCAQTLLAVEDDPYDKTMMELRRMCFPAPWGNPSDGTLEGLSKLGMKSVKQHFQGCYRPNGAILGVAGKVDVAAIKSLVEDAFGDWATLPDPEFASGPRGPHYGHFEQQSDQTHLAIAYNSVPYRHPDYYTAWAANWVLGGGSSARLFTEVRERRGLCYSVHSQMTATRDDGRVLCHAGVTVDRAQEALDVILQEIKRLPGSIQESELNRCKAGVKSELIMQQESSSSRAAGLSNDWFHLGRVVSLDEVRKKIEALTVNSLHAHLEQYPPQDFTILTLGPRPLTVTP